MRKNNLANPIIHIDDGEKALDFLFSPQPDPSLVLLDLKMPKVDGIQILRSLRADPGKRHIPVIALISSKEGRNYLESFGVRADAYMIKPIDAKQFSAAVAHIGIRSVILDNPGN